MMRAAATRFIVPQRPLISVILPVYNAERYVSDAIACIAAQTYPHWELLIVDDGSTDGSAAIAETFAAQDARMRVTRLPHGGLARAVNAGIDQAQGEMIARMDADDLCPPERFALQLDWMRASGVEVCGGWAEYFGGRSGLPWMPETHDAIRREQIFRLPLWAPTVMLHAEIFRANRADETVASDDYEMWARLAQRHRLGNMPAILLKLRWHEQQTHIVNAKACAEDHRRLRPGLIRALFADAQEADLATIEALVEKRPLELRGLDRSGYWLTRFADCSEPGLRRQMLGRWQQACHRSAALGGDVEAIYRQYAGQFGLPVSEMDVSLTEV